ncbi:MAG: NmrA/HSCARG family protein [Candidatus Zixiibacteriota bacterium]|jgi:uncharacterized protein YbjT (DUF2867 family)
MADKRIILVTGATGAQGGSVARHLLARGKFGVRCLTRHPESEKAKALKDAGCEIVRGDLADPASLPPALEGCYGVFGLTNFWEHYDKEFEQGKNLIDAVADSDVQHFVYSTLPPANKISGGKLPAPHLDLKAQLEEYARSKKLPATFVSVAFYYENFTTFFPPQPQEDGSFAFGFPQGDTPLAGVSVEDVGGVVAPIFENRDEFLGKVVGIVGDDLTPEQYARTMTDKLGVKVVYNYIPREVFASFDFPGADDLANMFEFNRL